VPASESPGGPKQPVLRKGPGNLVHLAWTSKGEKGEQTHFATFDGKTWSEPERIGQGPPFSGAPVFAVNGAGDIWCVHAAKSRKGESSGIRVHHRKAGETKWNGRATIRVPGGASRPVLATDGEGGAHMTYFAWSKTGRKSGQYHVFYTKTKRNLKSWEKPKNLQAAKGQRGYATLPGLDPQIACTGGKIRVAWFLFDGKEKRGVRTNTPDLGGAVVLANGPGSMLLRSFDGKRWGPLQRVFPLGIEKSRGSPQIRMDADAQGTFHFLLNTGKGNYVHTFSREE
ncbi:MAG: hypothetical protein ACYTHM_12485, partial [Planctomycetota bacterium]